MTKDNLNSEYKTCANMINTGSYTTYIFMHVLNKLDLFLENLKKVEEAGGQCRIAFYVTGIMHFCVCLRQRWAMKRRQRRFTWRWSSITFLLITATRAHEHQRRNQKESKRDSRRRRRREKKRILFFTGNCYVTTLQIGLVHLFFS